jgi:hypothetical protein
MTYRKTLAKSLYAVRTDLARSSPSWALMTHYQDVVAAAEAHLDTLPKTKTVDVWHVEWAYAGKPHVRLLPTKTQAGDEAYRLKGLNVTCVRVTGPHKHEVPA